MLVPLDGSPLSETVLPYAIALAGGGEYRVTLLSVWEVMPEEMEVVGNEHARVLRSEGMQYFRAYLGNIAESVAQEGIEVAVEVRAGHAAVQILAAIGELEADMVALASKGSGGEESSRRGSVADKVLRASSVPILVLGPRLLEAWPATKASLNSIVVPLDGTAEPEAALFLAVDLAKEAGARVSLLRVLPPLLGQTPTGMPETYPPEIHERVRQTANRYLKELRDRFPETVKEVHVMYGHPRQEIPRFIEREGSDLVVMTSHSRHGAGRWSLGGVADAVIEGTAPVVLASPLDTSAGDRAEERRERFP
jgi:nucleotide-binding universal stress UspA family protein